MGKVVRDKGGGLMGYGNDKKLSSQLPVVKKNPLVEAKFKTTALESSKGKVTAVGMRRLGLKTLEDHNEIITRVRRHDRNGDIANTFRRENGAS